MPRQHTYFYTLKDDAETYLVKYRCDDTAKAGLLDLFGGQLATIWRPERTVYGDR